MSKIEEYRLNELPVKYLTNENDFRPDVAKGGDLLVNEGDVYTFNKEDLFLITEIDSNVIFSVKLDLSCRKIIEG